MYYHVVERVLQEEACEIFTVPDPWIQLGDDSNSTATYWPPSGNISQMVLKGSEPDKLSWSLYPVTIKKSTSNYIKAKDLERKLSERTDVSSACSDEATMGIGKRKRKERSWSPLMETPRSQPTPTIQDSSDSDDDRRPPHLTPLLSSPSTSSNSFSYPRPPTPLRPLQKRSDSPATVVISERYLERLIRSNEELKAEVKNVRLGVDRLLALAHESRRATDAAQMGYPEGYTFPLSNPEDLERLDTQLSRDEPTRVRLVRQLGTIGGRDIKEAVRRVMAALVSTHLARQYNFLGMKGKKAFSTNRTVLRTVYEAIFVKNADTTQSVIKDCLAGWLAGSRDRDHGKKERMQRARAAQDVLEATSPGLPNVPNSGQFPF